MVALGTFSLQGLHSSNFLAVVQIRRARRQILSKIRQRGRRRALRKAARRRVLAKLARAVGLDLVSLECQSSHSLAQAARRRSVVIRRSRSSCSGSGNSTKTAVQIDTLKSRLMRVGAYKGVCASEEQTGWSPDRAGPRMYLGFRAKKRTRSRRTTSKRHSHSITRLPTRAKMISSSPELIWRTWSWQHPVVKGTHLHKLNKINQIRTSTIRSSKAIG